MQTVSLSTSAPTSTQLSLPLPAIDLSYPTQLDSAQGNISGKLQTISSSRDRSKMEYLQNLPSGYSDSLLDSGVSWDAQDIYWGALYMDWSAQQGESSFQYPSFWPEPSWARAARLEEERAARLAKYRARLAEFRERRLYANVVAQLERLRPVEFPEPTRNRAPRKPVPNPVSPKSPAVRSTSHRRRTTQEDITPRIVPKRNVHYCFSSWLSRARPQVDEEPDQEEEVIGTSFPRTPTTSVASLNLEPDVRNSHLHDMELCELLHSLEARNMPEIAKEPFRKAVRARLRKLGLKYDDEVSGSSVICHEALISSLDLLLKSIRKYRMSFHDHDPQVHLRPNFVPELSEVRCLPRYWFLYDLIRFYNSEANSLIGQGNSYRVC